MKRYGYKFYKRSANESKYIDLRLFIVICAFIILAIDIMVGLRGRLISTVLFTGVFQFAFLLMAEDAPKTFLSLTAITCLPFIALIVYFGTNQYLENPDLAIIFISILIAAPHTYVASSCIYKLNRLINNG
jgi:hypothetical protein